MIINEKPKGGLWARSSLEKEFETFWEKRHKKIVLHAELRHIKGRQFRWDYTHKPSKTLIEIQGGLFMKNKRGGHSTGKGIRKDYFKSNTMLTQGYVTVFLGTGDLTNENIDLVRSIIDSRLK